MDLVSQARKAKEHTEKLLDEAFGFLERDYNYESIPVEPGSGPYHQFTKRYQLGGRSICFFVDFDYKGIFGMYISPVDLQARQEMHPNIRYVPMSNVFLERSEDSPNSKGNNSLRDALKFYADLLQSEFSKELAGDFSAYPAIEYTVELVKSGIPENRSNRIAKFADVSAAETCALKTIGEASMGPNDYMQLTARFAQ